MKAKCQVDSQKGGVVRFTSADSLILGTLQMKDFTMDMVLILKMMEQSMQKQSLKMDSQKPLNKMKTRAKVTRHIRKEKENS